MKNYDFQKAKQIIEENRENIAEASLGMREDWFWTAETVFEDGEFTQELTDEQVIGGISGSSWATPAIGLVFKDGTEKMHPCFLGESDGEKPLFVQLGVLSAHVQDSLPPLDE